ncbi:MAG TPA: hypothetical protein PLP27_04960 [Crocinitomicaceae bacterium]|nr:hypothetical protein [Crocinitomicaceae bacterium]
MIKHFLLFFACVIPFLNFAQHEALNSEQRAYLFHIVRKSPILENNIGRYFEYKGPEIKFNNQQLNYDSIENYIINNPSALVIHASEIKKSSVGILSEAANKVAIWELNKMLLAKRTKNDKEFGIYEARYERFEDLLKINLPATALKNENTTIHPKVEQLLNPSLHLNDKIKMVETFHFLNTSDQLATLDGISKAINEYVKQRTYDIFCQLGGNAEKFENILVAAGDGSLTAGLLEEREKDENGRWNKGLPKAIGLFPYQLKIVPQKNKDTSPIQPNRITSNYFMTAHGNAKATNIHFDVWGYNSTKQTTVVIEKNGKTYHLFGSGETRFLSPDSAFTKGDTYQKTIDSYQEKINKLDEKIYGKKGYDYWIAYHEKKRDNYKLQVLNLEQEISYINSFKINTKQNGVKQKNQEIDKTVYDKKNRKEAQNQYIYLNEMLSAETKKVKELQKEKEQALEIRAELETKMNGCINAFGRNWVPFTENNGLYTFADSTTFDMLTQDLKFPPTKDAEYVEVRLIAIPEFPTSDQADEVMLHINATYVNPDYNARIQLKFEDVFQSNSWNLDKNIINAEDSLSVHVFLEQLLDKKKEFNIIVRGNGIGFWNGIKTVYKSNQSELEKYETFKDDTTYKRLRTSEVNIFADRSILLEINSFTDPVRTTFEIPNAKVAELISKNTSYNQVLSGYRSATILFKLQDELNVKAGEYFSREQAKIIIDRLNMAFSKAKILIGQTSIKASYFK